MSSFYEFFSETMYTEKSVERLNEKYGYLRISVTHACQLKCRFCHQEGIEDHWVPKHIDEKFLYNIVKAFSNIGGRFVEFTGGEPLLHPRIDYLVESISDLGPKLAICTNGLLLDRLKRPLENGSIARLKISLHATENSDDAQWLLGKGWDFQKVMRNIILAKNLGVNVQLIYTHTKKNSENLTKVLDIADRLGVDVQVVDLIKTRSNQCFNDLEYMDAQEAEMVLSNYSQDISFDTNRMGGHLKIYKKGNSVWELKNTEFGLLNTGMCKGCEYKDICGEGVYALRIDAAGILKPCLLRKDLESSLSTSDKIDTIETALLSSLNKMMS